MFQHRDYPQHAPSPQPLIVHDGFATIRRAPYSCRSRLVQVQQQQVGHQQHHAQPHSQLQSFLDTVVEEPSSATVHFRPKPDVPWWEIATRRSKYHSCSDLQAHVVTACQETLSKMTERLQQLTATNEKKDSELMEARKIIEMLRKQNGENPSKDNGSSQNCSPSLARRHTINTTIDSNSNNNISRQLSTDSVSSLVSMSSACSMSSGNQHIDLNAADKNKKKTNWFRSSFSKAFSRSKKNRNGSVSDIEDSRTTQSDMSAPSSPLLNSPHLHNGCLSNDYKSAGLPPLKSSQSSSELHDNTDAFANDEGDGGPDVVQKLQKELRKKDILLTDIRLEALSSAGQLESLKDTVSKMRNDMLLLKQDNERLQRIVTSKSLVSSQSSLQTHDCIDRRYSTTDVPTERSELDFMFTDPLDMDAKKVAVWVFFGSHGGYHKYVDERNERNDCPISLIPVTTKTDWESLDNLVFRAFKEYLERIDPGTNLDLTQDSIWSYQVGEVTRYMDSKNPELLPCGYLVGGSSSSITIYLKGALHSGCLDALSFEMLIPKSIVQRYVAQLSEHRRIMLYGPGGTGKTCLASKLAEYILYRDGKEITPNSIATFNVDEKSSKDLRQYLLNLAEQAESNSTTNELPSAIILDNLHLASSLTDVLNSVVGLKSEKYCPYLIGTLNQSNCSSNNLQLHHNFRWILFANHLEPVKNFLSRYLRRRLIEIECKKASRNPELRHIVEWIPKIQQHLNQFLETHASSDVTIGPKLFMSCPMEVDGSQVWFTDLWNYSLVPYLLAAVKDGLQPYGKRAPWEDPSSFIRRNYPWCKSTNIHGGIEALMRLRPEDVGYEVKPEADPLLNMLMTLQDAANYSSSTHSNECDSTSNSNLTVGIANSSI
ncbi:hypothetical protein V9T40_007267 [Parthenolecanium corni]|uniref:AAA+ ATPase domain-containing protein n=1 Tax=Parthenolecanium corni TaxID=536013 RepID=A0AAN9TU91_9HEMI